VDFSDRWDPEKIRDDAELFEVIIDNKDHDDPGHPLIPSFRLQQLAIRPDNGTEKQARRQPPAPDAPALDEVDIDFYSDDLFQSGTDDQDAQGALSRSATPQEDADREVEDGGEISFVNEYDDPEVTVVEPPPPILPENEDSDLLFDEIF
jgi:hypothetical protein